LEKNLIFYQSISEIFEILRIVKKYPFGKCVIIVTGGPHFLGVLDSLKFKNRFGTTIYEFCGLSLKNPFDLLRMYLRFNYSSDYKELLSQSFNKAFFFCKYIDFVAPIFLCQKNIKKLIYIDLYKFVFKKKKIKLSIRHLIQKIIIKILHKNINVKMTFWKLFPGNDWIVMYFYCFGKKINPRLPSRVPKKYFFDLPLSKKIISKKKIIYIDSDDESLIGSEFRNVILKVFKIAEDQGYQIVIKKHPRTKLSEIFYISKKWIIITDPMPIELFNLKKVDCLIGFFSSGLAKISDKYSCIRVFSIVNLLSQDMRKKFEKNILTFHNNLTKNNKVYYPNSFKKVEEIIKKK
jgi:hypothetical protein